MCRGGLGTSSERNVYAAPAAQNVVGRDRFCTVRVVLLCVPLLLLSVRPYLAAWLRI